MRICRLLKGLQKAMLSPSERVIRATLASYQSWGNTTDRAARTANARNALEAKFLADADGDPQRAAALRKAYYARLTFKSLQARRKRAAAKAAADTTRPS